MKETDWSGLEDEALEMLLVERWLFRGVLLILMLAAAILMTYLGMEGMTTLMDGLAVGSLIAITSFAGAIVFVMRATDIRMHRELRRRRS
jgi:hypothetical protein